MRVLPVVALGALLSMQLEAQAPRPRAREIGVAPGVFQPGPRNAITDVAGVRVGQTTVIEGDSVRTGITAILPHEGNPFFDRVPAALHVGNGFGKLLGVTQLTELGELETPILLTCTLCVSCRYWALQWARSWAAMRSETRRNAMAVMVRS